MALRCLAARWRKAAAPQAPDSSSGSFRNAGPKPTAPLPLPFEPLRSALIQILKNVIDSSAANHAVLSHRPGQHLQNLADTHSPAFDQARYHLHITNHLRVEPAVMPLYQVPAGVRRSAAQRCFRWQLCPLAVLKLFLLLAFRRAVVLDATFRRTPLAVRVSAPERATEIIAAGVTWMSQEKYAAVSTAGQASTKARVVLQYGPEDEIVLQHKSVNPRLTVPARPKLKMLPDFYNQKPSVSLRILTVIGMLRPTRSAHRVSRGRTKLFSAALRLPLLLGNECYGVSLSEQGWGHCS